METEVARRIPMPIEYQEACRQLVACTAIDEAKYFCDKAVALAAWGKIYHSREAELAAKRLRLHAYRRMGQIAMEIRPAYRKEKSLVSRGGSNPGPLSALRDAGINKGPAENMRTISLMSEDLFQSHVNSGRPPSPTALSRMSNRGRTSDHYRKMRYSTSSIGPFKSFCQQNPPKESAIGLSVDEAQTIKKIVVYVQEWLDQFERFLPTPCSAPSAPTAANRTGEP